MPAYGGEDRGPLLLVVCWVFNGIALALVILRLISHLKIAKTGGIDDIFVTLATLVNLARAILVSVAVGRGFGKHIYKIEPPSRIPSLLRLAVILQGLGVWTWSLPKLAVVALLQRIFVPGWHTTAALYGMTSVLLVFSLVLTVVTFVQCTPREYTWNRMIPGGHCWNPNIQLDLGYFAGAYSIALDFLYAVYPLFKVWQIQMSMRKKIVVCASLGLGIPAAITSAIKQSLVKEVATTEDTTWATVPLEVWNSIEGNLLVIAASLPLIKPVLRALIGRLTVLTSRYNTSKNNGSSSAGRGAREATTRTDEPKTQMFNQYASDHRPTGQHIQSEDDDGIRLIEMPKKGHDYEDDWRV